MRVAFDQRFGSWGCSCTYWQSLNGGSLPHTGHGLGNGKRVGLQAVRTCLKIEEIVRLMQPRARNNLQSGGHGDTKAKLKKS
jgi:hypothetical protein